MTSPCKEPGCDKPCKKYKSSGLCNTHYWSEWERKNPECSAENCTRPSSVKGKCDRHYRRERKGMDPDAPIAISRKRGSALERDVEGRKECGKCRRWLDLSNFGVANDRLDGLQRTCKDCLRIRDWKRFKLTPTDVAAMLDAQDYKCAICPESIEDWFCVDHDHSCCPSGAGPGNKAGCCGKCVRGLLCRLCNNGLGHFRDSPENLTAAIHYLQAGGVDYGRAIPA